MSTTSAKNSRRTGTSLTAFIRCAGMICVACAITLSAYVDSGLLSWLV